MNRNIFFFPGFEPQQIAEIIGKKKQNKKRLEKIRQRKQMERRQIKWGKLNATDWLATKKIKAEKTDQIQYGFDLAIWWNEQHE